MNVTIQKVPQNKFGISSYIDDNDLFTVEEIMKIINGPVAAIEPEYQADLAKPVIVSDELFPR
jgi:hypothetical protein